MFRPFGVLLVLTALATPSFAQEGGSQSDKMTKRPRDQAALTGGEVIQLETMWIPVKIPEGRRYLGATVQLRPSPDKMPEACYATPWVTEALIIYLNAHPLTTGNTVEMEGPALAGALLGAADAVAGKGVFKAVEVTDGPGGRLDHADAELTLACL